MHDEPLRPLKRLRLRGQEGHSSRLLSNPGPSSAAFPLKTPKLEDDATIPGSSARIEGHQVQPQDAIVDKGKQPVSPQDIPGGRRILSNGNSPAVPSSKNKMPYPYNFIIPKDEPVDDIPDYVVPLAVIHPGIQLTMP